MMGQHPENIMDGGKLHMGMIYLTAGKHQTSEPVVRGQHPTGFCPISPLVCVQTVPRLPAATKEQKRRPHCRPVVALRTAHVRRPCSDSLPQTVSHARVARNAGCESASCVATHWEP